MSTPKSNRRLAFDKLKELCRQARNGSYFAKRGVIVWVFFPWENYKRAISIQIDESDFMRSTNRADCAIEIAAKIPGEDELPEIDDALMDEFHEDLESILRAWLRASDEVGNFVAGFVPGKITEFHDIEERVQGITAKFTVEF